MPRVTKGGKEGRACDVPVNVACLSTMSASGGQVAKTRTLPTITGAAKISDMIELYANSTTKL